MGDCPLCSHPLIWSDDHGRAWCSVWGTHAAQLLPPAPGPLMIAAANVGLSMKPGAIRQRRHAQRKRERCPK